MFCRSLFVLLSFFSVLLWYTILIAHLVSSNSSYVLYIYIKQINLFKQTNLKDDSLRNIHRLNDHGYFPFYEDLFLYSVADKTFTGLNYMRITAGVIYTAGTDYPSWISRFTFMFVVGSVLLVWFWFSALCYGFFLFVLFILFAHCCQYLWIAHCCQYLWIAHCCQYLWIAHSWLPLRFSLTCI